MVQTSPLLKAQGGPGYFLSQEKQGLKYESVPVADFSIEKNLRKKKKKKTYDIIHK